MRVAINFTIKNSGRLKVNPAVRINATVPEAHRVSNKLIVGEKEFDGSAEVEITAADLGALTEIPVASDEVLGGILTNYYTEPGSDNRPVKVDENGNAYVTIPLSGQVVSNVAANSIAIINLQNDVNTLEDKVVDLTKNKLDKVGGDLDKDFNLKAPNINLETENFNITGTTKVDGDATFKGDTTVEQNLSVKETINSDGDITTKNNLIVEKASTLNSLTVENNSNLNTLDVADTLNVEGDSTLNSLTVNNNTSTKSLNVKEDVNVRQGDIILEEGNIHLRNVDEAETGHGDLTVEGKSTLNKLEVNKEAEFRNKLKIINDLINILIENNKISLDAKDIILKHSFAGADITPQSRYLDIYSYVPNKSGVVTFNIGDNAITGYKQSKSYTITNQHSESIKTTYLLQLGNSTNQHVTISNTPFNSTLTVKYVSSSSSQITLTIKYTDAETSETKTYTSQKISAIKEGNTYTNIFTFNEIAIKQGTTIDLSASSSSLSLVDAQFNEIIAGPDYNMIGLDQNGNIIIDASKGDDTLIKLIGNAVLNGKQVATIDDVSQQVAALVDSSPEALNTLNELANALNNDPDFAATITNELSKKADSTKVDQVDALANEANGTATAAFNGLYTPFEFNYQVDEWHVLSNNSIAVSGIKIDKSETMNLDAIAKTSYINTQNNRALLDTLVGISNTNSATIINHTNRLDSIGGQVSTNTGNISNHTYRLENLATSVSILYGNLDSLDERTRQMYGQTNQADIQRLYADERPTDPVKGQIFCLINPDTNEQTYYKYNGNDWIEISSLLEVTHEQLKTLRDNNHLIPGMQYRITDYTCTTTQLDTQSANHQFDIIVTADSTNVLNENARACLHDSDTYFANCKLESWEIKYSLDNNTTRFLWANPSNGKGVIYYMKDEFGNECPYDFKNIQFKRYACTLKDEYTSMYADSAYATFKYWGTASYTPVIFTMESVDSIWVYTFHEINNNTDSTVIVDKKGRCYSNIIKGYNSLATVNSSEVVRQRLNNIVFYTNKSTNNSTAHNIFEDNCGIMTFYGACQYNNFNSNCYNNTFGNNSFNNIFGIECHDNTFGNSFYNNQFDNACFSNTFGNDCFLNNFGINCFSNTFGNYSIMNIFGHGNHDCFFKNVCEGNSFGNECGSIVLDSGNFNSFGNQCFSITLGNNYSYNSFGNGCSNISFKNSNNTVSDYANNNIFDNGVSSISLITLTEGSSSNLLQNVYVHQGVKGKAIEIERNALGQINIVANKTKEIILDE